MSRRSEFLRSSTAASVASPPTAAFSPLVDFPGWRKPVLGAYGDSFRADLAPGCPSAKRGNKASPIAHAVMMNEGKAFGAEVFDMAAKSLLMKVEAGASPALGLSLAFALDHFCESARQITDAHAATGGMATPERVAHWMAARGEFGVRVLQFIDRLLKSIRSTLEGSFRTEWDAFAWSQIVLAFVFPGHGEKPKDDAWRAEKRRQLQEMHDAVRARIDG